MSDRALSDAAKPQAKKNPKHGLEPSAWTLLEGAVHLLRRAPLSAWLIYLSGAIPWLLVVLFFWAHTTWFGPTTEQIAWQALGVSGCFLWLKVTQAEFAARLNALCHVTPPESFRAARVRRLLFEQTTLQVWGLLVLPVALVLSVPFGWAYAYYQHASVIGLTKDRTLGAAARREAALWPGQNHMALLGFSLLFLTVWLNLAFTFYAIPWLANRLLGVDNLFGFSGWWWFNTTFLASVTMLSWLLCDPLVKAFYVLRHFHGQAQETGADLRSVLAAHRAKQSEARAARGAVVTLALGLTAGALLLAPTPVQAETSAPPPAPAGVVSPQAPVSPSVDPQQLDAAIKDVLTHSDYQWQLRPLPREHTADEKLGPVGRFLREGLNRLDGSWQWIKKTVKSIWDWFAGLFPDRKSSSSKTSVVASSTSALQFFLYALLAVAVLLILWVVWLVIKQKSSTAPHAVAASAVAAPAPDLRDENVHAAQMPEDGWLALAREQVAKGEWRLALRALYLARLARLGGQGLLSLAKHKTNLDYERELTRRAAGRAELQRDFTAARRSFEEVWYGHGRADESLVRGWLRELEVVQS